MFIVNVITLVILGLAEKFYLLLISIHLYPLSLSLSTPLNSLPFSFVNTYLLLKPRHLLFVWK